MRNRVRRQSYVDRELERRARAHAIAHGLTDSAVTEAALIKYLDGDGVDKALVVRRLDRVTQVVDKLQHDLNALALTVDQYAKHWFYSGALPVSSPEALQRAESNYRGFLRIVSDQLTGGVRYPGKLLRAGSNLPPRPGTRPDGDGGKGGSAR